MHLKELFINDITDRFDSVSRYTLNDDKYISREINEFIFTEGSERNAGSYQIFCDILSTLSQEKVVHLWIHGFYGSGKSLLTKLLALSLANRKIAERNVFDLLLEKLSPSNVQTLKQLFQSCQFTGITSFNLSGRRRSKGDYPENIVTVIVRELFRHFEFSNYSLQTACSELKLQNLNQTDDFVKWVKSNKSASWESLKNDSVGQTVIQEYFQVHGLQNVTLPVLNHGSPEKWVQNWAKILRTLEGTRHVIIIDEVSKHLDTFKTEVDLLRVFVKSLKGSQFQLVCTAQTPVNKYGKLNIQFSSVIVDKINIDEIIVGRLLKKRKEQHSAIKDFMKHSYIFDGGSKRHLEIYPFTPLTLDLLKVITKQIKSQNEEQQTARSILGLLHQYLADNADRLASHIHGLDGFYEIFLRSFPDRFQQMVSEAFLKVEDSPIKNELEREIRICIIRTLISLTPLYDNIDSEKDSLKQILEPYREEDEDHVVSSTVLRLLLQHSAIGKQEIEMVESQLEWLKDNNIVQILEKTGYTLRLPSIEVWYAHLASVQIKPFQVENRIKAIFKEKWSGLQLPTVSLQNTGKSPTATSSTDVEVNVTVNQKIMIECPANLPFVSIGFDTTKSLKCQETNGKYHTSSTYEDLLYAPTEGLLKEEKMLEWSQSSDVEATALWTNLKKQTQERIEKHKAEINNNLKDLLLGNTLLHESDEDWRRQLKDILFEELNKRAKTSFNQHHYCGISPKDLTGWVANFCKLNSDKPADRRAIEDMQERMNRNGMRFFTNNTFSPEGVLVDWLEGLVEVDLKNIMTHANKAPYAYNQQEIHLTLVALFVKGRIQFRRIGRKTEEILLGKHLTPETIEKVSDWKRLRTFTFSLMKSDVLSVSDIETLQEFLKRTHHVGRYETATAIFEGLTSSHLPALFEEFINNVADGIFTIDSIDIQKELVWYRSEFQSHFIAADIVTTLKEFIKKTQRFEKLYSKLTPINTSWTQIGSALSEVSFMKSAKDTSHPLSSEWEQLLEITKASMNVSKLLWITTQLESIMSTVEQVKQTFNGEVKEFWKWIEGHVSNLGTVDLIKVDNPHVPKCLTVQNGRFIVHRIDISNFTELEQYRNHVTLFIDLLLESLSQETIHFTQTTLNKDTEASFFAEIRSSIDECKAKKMRLKPS